MDCPTSHSSGRNLNHLAANRLKGAMENPQENTHICHLSMSQAPWPEFCYLRARFVGLRRYINHRNMLTNRADFSSTLFSLSRFPTYPHYYHIFRVLLKFQSGVRWYVGLHRPQLHQYPFIWNFGDK